MAVLSTKADNPAISPSSAAATKSENDGGSLPRHHMEVLSNFCDGVGVVDIGMNGRVLIYV